MIDNVEKHLSNISQLREKIGTKPRELETKPTEYLRGGEGVQVKMLSPQYPHTNFYFGMFCMAVQTWGGPWDSAVTKWNNSSPEDRFTAVKAIMERQALPLALEHPQFLFEISGCSRSSFDQIARARLGVTFSSMGTRDNAHGDFAVVVPPNVYDNEALLHEFKAGVEHSKAVYVEMLKAGRSWQDARAMLPQSMVHRFSMNLNYAAMSTFMGKRLQFCEQYDTVAVAWKMRAELEKYYALFALTLRPSCDYARKCTYHQTNLNELFSNLFNGCGRWPDPYPAGDFNESSTEQKDIQQWTASTIEQINLINNGEYKTDWEVAFEGDKHFFEQQY
jgi:hypothetical protein